MHVPLIVWCLSLVLSVSSQVVSSHPAQDSLRGWQAKSLTSAIVLESVEESGTEVTFSFKNVSGRVISAFAINFGYDQSPSGPVPHRSAARYRDWFGSEPNGWLASDIEQVTSSTNNRRIQQHSLEISAVVFVDGTSEGWQPHIDSVLFSRSGRILETERIRNVLASTNARFAGDWEVKTLIEKIGRLPESADLALDEVTAGAAGLSMSNLPPRGTVPRGAFLSGVRGAREEMLWDIDRLRKLPPASADPSVQTQAGFLFQLRQQYDEKAIRHRAYLKRTRGDKAQ